MAVNLDINNYSQETARQVEHLIGQYTKGTRLANRSGEIFQICDELLKNAVKSNFKFLLLWMATRKRVMESNPDFTKTDADEWLTEIFFSGENILLQKQLEKIPNWSEMQSTNVRRLLNLENELMKHKSTGTINHPDTDENFQSFSLLLRVKRLARQLGVGIHFRIESSPQQILITVKNDSPILTEDVQRIARIREKFRGYVERNERHLFFIENMDTSGGGHGLGYALMDSILLDMDLDPEKCLYLVSAERAMVLLVLPLTPAAAAAAASVSV